MNIRERLEAFWAGERPDQIPYTIYRWEWRHTADDPAWQGLFDLGLGVTWHLPSVVTTPYGIDEMTDRTTIDGLLHERRTIYTPVGSIYETFVDGWRTKYLLETAEDYRVMTYITRHSRVEPIFETYLAEVAALPPHAVPLVYVPRTPLQIILVDLAGAGNFAYHLFDLEDEVRELYDALLENYRRTVQLVAEGPGRYAYILENFTAEMLGPARYAEFLLPVYQSLFPLLHQAGKVVSTHYDGRLASCKDLIATAPIDVIESFTVPPEGDMTLADARAVWPEKRFWSNLNIGCYQLPAAELRQLVLDRVAQGAPDGRKLAFEVSEQFPANWKESMRTVLLALQETCA